MANVRVPPNSKEVEMSVLGALLIDRDAMLELAGWLKPEHFYSQSHEVIYEVMLELYEDRKPIDIVTLSEGLKRKKALKTIGGVAYLTDLANQVPTSANVIEYATIVRKYAVKRSLIAAAGRLAELGFDEGTEAQECLDSAEAEIFALSDNGSGKSFISVRDVLSGTLDRYNAVHDNNGELRGVPSGFRDLDEALAGFQDSNLIILAARPGTGKTAFSLNICQFAAVEKKIPVGIFALEMSNEELVDRLLVAEADIDAWRLKTGKLTDQEHESFTNAMGVLAEAPIYIDDTPGLSILDIRTRARRLKMSHGIRMLVVDYLQLAHSHRKTEGRTQEVQEISQGLKLIARELKIPVIALSQLSRAVEQRGTKRPQLSDLRESGSIEQDADVVMFLWRENDEQLERVNLSIEKHRNGATGTVPLYFRGERIKFFGIDEKH